MGRARTSKTVISTGMMVPAWSWVLALYSLQNIMMFTPWVRKEGAGRTGRSALEIRSCLRVRYGGAKNGG